MLAVVAVLRVDFPDLYLRIVERPGLLREILSVIAGGNPAELPSSAQIHLHEFLEVREGALTKTFKGHYRALRTYLSSLHGLELPRRIEPLLLLAEDTLTRHFGDKAAELYEAFVSGDSYGVLEGLGRHLDDKPISVQDARLLGDMIETVRDESVIRRVSAARVLANVADRVPVEAAIALMTPLARQLATEVQVRMNTGPEKAGRIVPKLRPDDQKLVAAKYCEDLLGEEIGDYRLPDGGKPSLTELTAMVKSACDLALSVRSQHQLPPAADRLLLDWLETRSITVSGETTSLPFSVLDDRMQKHESHLLPDMGERYSDLAIAELESDRLEAGRRGEVLGRIQRVFESLAKLGEDERRVLWGQVTRLVGVKAEEAVACAWLAAEQFADTASDEDASLLVAALSIRLKSQLDDEDNWPLDWKTGGVTALRLVGRWKGHLSAESLTTFASLVNAWSTIGDTCEFASQGFRLVESTQVELLAPVLDSWSGKPLGKLCWPCRGLLADRLFSRLNAEQQNKVAAQLNAVVNSTDLEPEVAADYRKFADAVPDESWKEAPFRQHVERLFNRVVAMAQDQDNYLSELFPAAVRLLTCAPAGTAGSMLTLLFSEARAVPDAYALVHAEMSGKWPEEDVEIGTYGAAEIFDGAAAFVAAYPSHERIDAVVRSMESMLALERVPAEKAPAFAEVCCNVWPHSPKVVVECIDTAAPCILPKKLPALMETASSEEPDLLDRLLRSLLQAWSDEQVSRATTRLLEASPIEMRGRADGGLSCWIDVVSDRGAVLGDVLAAKDMNDAQHQRAYLQALRCGASLGVAFFCSAIPVAMSHSEHEQTRKTVLEATDQVTALVSTEDDKAKLASVLIELLPAAANSDTVRLADWINSLGGKGALEKRKDLLDGMEVEQLAILADRMKPSKPLNRMLEASQLEAEKPDPGSADAG